MTNTEIIQKLLQEGIEKLSKEPNSVRYLTEFLSDYTKHYVFEEQYRAIGMSEESEKFDDGLESTTWWAYNPEISDEEENTYDYVSFMLKREIFFYPGKSLYWWTLQANNNCVRDCCATFVLAEHKDISEYEAILSIN